MNSYYDNTRFYRMDTGQLRADAREESGKKRKNSDGFGGMKLERFGADCVKCSRALEGKKKMREINR